MLLHCDGSLLEHQKSYKIPFFKDTCQLSLTDYVHNKYQYGSDILGEVGELTYFKFQVSTNSLEVFIKVYLNVCVFRKILNFC